MEQSAVDYRPHSPLLQPLVTHTCLYVQQIVMFIYDGHYGSLAKCLALDSGISLSPRTAMFLVMAVVVTPGPAFRHILQASKCDAYSSSYEVVCADLALAESLTFLR